MEIMGFKKRIAAEVLAIVYFIFAPILVTYPIIRDFSTYIFGIGDELIITFVLNWNIYSILNNIVNIYNAPIFYPHSNALAFTDTFFVSAVIGLLPHLITGEPIAVYNFNIIFSIMAMGYSTNLLVKYLTKSCLSGILSGTLMAFSVYSVTRYFHLQLISAFFVPLAILSLLYAIEKKKQRFLCFYCLCILLQAANSFFPVYLIFFISAIIILYFLYSQKLRISFFTNVRVIILFAITFFSLFMLGLPYLQISGKYNYVRDIRDTINFANRPEYFLYPSRYTRLESNLKNLYKSDQNNLKHDGYWGIGLLITAVLLPYIFIIKRSFFNKRYINIFCIGFIFSYLMSLGPFLQIWGKVIKYPFPIPLPYVIFYYLVPGFKGFRNSARWELLAVLCLSVIAGILFSELSRRKSLSLRLFLVMVFCYVIFFEIKLPMQTVAVSNYRNYPKIYSALAKLQKQSIVAEFPLYNWNMTPHSINENMRLLYSSSHNLKRLNGVSGFYPQSWQENAEFLYKNFPYASAINKLKKLGITHLVVHQREFEILYNTDYIVLATRPKMWSDIYTELNNNRKLQYVGTYGTDHLYIIK